MSMHTTVPQTLTASRERFEQLAAEWKEQAKFLSNTAQIAMLRPYQKIIGMGSEVIPLILEELRCEPRQWFWALEVLTDANPVQPQDAGDVQRMAAAWVDWGVNQGLLRP